MAIRAGWREAPIDLTGAVPDAALSAEGVPMARCLYGPITAQLQDHESYACQLKTLLAVRDACGIATSTQLAIPDVVSPGLLVMVHDLPNRRGLEITVLNFGRVAVDEIVTLDVPDGGPVVDIVAHKIKGKIAEDGHFRLQLQPLEGGRCFALPVRRPELLVRPVVRSLLQGMR